MFGNNLKRKTIRVLNERFDYQIGSFQKPTPTQIVKMAKENNGNEFDAAFLFMAVQLNSLHHPMFIDDDPHRIERKMTFVTRHISNLESIVPYCNSDQSELAQTLILLKSNFDLSPR